MLPSRIDPILITDKQEFPYNMRQTRSTTVCTDRYFKSIGHDMWKTHYFCNLYITICGQSILYAHPEFKLLATLETLAPCRVLYYGASFA